MLSRMLLLSLLTAQPDQAAAKWFRDMGEALHRPQTLHCAFASKVEGSLEGDVTGRLLMVWPENKVCLRINGRIIGTVRTSVRCDGERYMVRRFWGTGKPLAAPGDVSRRLLDALSHSGLVAVMPFYLQKDPAKLPPLKGHFQVSQFRLGNRVQLGDRRAQVIYYTLAVRGQAKPLTVTLWIDGASKLPLKRETAGDFGQFKGKFVETYSQILLNEKVATDRFAFPKSWTTPTREATPDEQKRLPSPADIVAFAAYPAEMPSIAGSFTVRQEDVHRVLQTYQVMSYKTWCSAYHHIAGADRSGTITLKNGDEILWMVRPGGVAVLTFPDNTVFYLGMPPR